MLVRADVDGNSLQYLGNLLILRMDNEIKKYIYHK